MVSDPKAFIELNLPIRPVPCLPDIRLHLAAPDSGVWRLAGEGNPPYWAWVWPGGQALTQHVLANPDVVANRVVLDFGTGSGLVAIAAAKAGAGRVIACDIDPHAIVAVEINASLNDTKIETRLADVTGGNLPGIDCVLVGDVFYDPLVAAHVLPFLQRCKAMGALVLIGDIGRTDLPNDRLNELARYPVIEVGERENREARVFSLR